ncbi:uncharacterized protein SPAPADRAFT_156828 [Spathaspora passalidarum NRRL Y-27907]|uniref:Non-structural maintenance of chromosomes element 1 homolog n=1 Tax=Spathaspora passalidarum (strain NRRL Y-27907 / 11-Y1) TaxID=619300 RepID=G3ASQ3_SPAPN|nr:uncharacterized protein SPAPADRAFT_156828 [Spathaspora passalidarum NRRL Y-27907]EGW31117.1 hypothetical protein SPAPADRAFT_156828 [Spathaspora passalidarum NRRL Y-27907]
MSEYTDIHRVLLTYIRSCKYIYHHELLETFQTIYTNLSGESPHEEPLQQLNKYLADINSRISPHGFKIERKNNELTGELCYIFINTVGDDIIKQNTLYSPPELDTIKQIIDDIVEAPEYKFSLGKVNVQQKIANSLNKTLKEASNLVDRLIDDGWFEVTLDDRMTLSIKTIAELKDYLIDRHGSSTNEGKILICQQCKEIVTLGCKHEDYFFHFKCYDVYCRNNNIEPDQDFQRIGPENV